MARNHWEAEEEEGTRDGAGTVAQGQPQKSLSFRDNESQSPGKILGDHMAPAPADGNLQPCREVDKRDGDP